MAPALLGEVSTASFAASIPAAVDDGDAYIGWLLWRVLDGPLLGGLTGVGWSPLEPARSAVAGPYGGVQVLANRERTISWAITVEHGFGAATRGDTLVIGRVAIWGGQNLKHRRGDFAYPLSFDTLLDRRHEDHDDRWHVPPVAQPHAHHEHRLLDALRRAYRVR